MSLYYLPYETRLFPEYDLYVHIRLQLRISNDQVIQYVSPLIRYSPKTRRNYTSMIRTNRCLAVHDPEIVVLVCAVFSRNIVRHFSRGQICIKLWTCVTCVRSLSYLGKSTLVWPWRQGLEVRGPATSSLQLAPIKQKRMRPYIQDGELIVKWETKVGLLAGKSLCEAEK